MASKYLQKFPIPEEFPDILMAFTREILRDQPADINEYGAMYFKAMHDVSRRTKSKWKVSITIIIQCVTY